MSRFDQAFQFIGGDHGNAFLAAAANDDDFTVLGDFVAQPGVICPSPCIGSLQSCFLLIGGTAFLCITSSLPATSVFTHGEPVLASSKK